MFQLTASLVHPMLLLPMRSPTLEVLIGIMAAAVLITIAAFLASVRVARNLQLQTPSGRATGGAQRHRLLGSVRTAGYGIALLGLVTTVTGVMLLLRFSARTDHYQLLRELAHNEAALVTEAHLWLEEAIHGDETVDGERDVIGLLAAARRSCEASLRGGMVEMTAVPPLHDGRLRPEIARRCALMDELSVIARSRMAAPEQSGPGSVADEEFDATYALAIGSIQSTRNAVAPLLQAARRQTAWIGAGLLIVLFLIAAVTARLMAVVRRVIVSDFRDLQRLAAIVRSSGEAMYTVRLDGTIQDWNDAAKRIYGYDADDVLGRPASLLVPPVHLLERVRFLDRILQAEAVGFLDSEDLRSDGTRFFVALSVAPIRDESNAIVSYSVVARDVTEQKIAEAKLRAANERYVLAARAASDLILEWDVRNHTTRWVDGVPSAFGYSADEDEIGAGLDWWLDRIHPDDVQEVRARAVAAIEGSAEACTWEFRFRCADGGYTNVLYRGYIQRDEHGNALRMIGALTDVSALKEIEQALIRAKELAERASQLKSEFLNSMSHELRTPLNAVIGFASVLQKNGRGNLQEQELLLLERIRANGNHLLELIDEILDLARIESGKVEIQTAPVALDHLVQEVVDGLKGVGNGEPVTLTTQFPESLESLETDAMRLRQILINIIGNAIKFTPRGSVQVSIIAHPECRKPIRIDVADTGIGIPADRLASIFLPFEQGETGTTRRYRGTGLGLSISRALADLLGYRITVRSEPAVGSVFSIILATEGKHAVPPDPLQSGYRELAKSVEGTPNALEGYPSGVGAVKG
jgi:PAS domain S-box-containing protein